MYFTFQSGSILIMEMRMRGYKEITLYIPIWFYSNTDITTETFDSQAFTFQSGSILISRL